MRSSRRTCPETSTVQLGLVTEELNRRWYEASTGEVIADIQKQVRHPTVRWLAATPDGRVQSNSAVFESKFMLPWYFSEEAAAAKYMPQLQHNMFVLTARSAVLVGHHRRRQVGRDQGARRPAPSAPDHDRGTEVLALRGKWRAPSPVRPGAAETPDRGGSDCRHDFVECVGGIRRQFLPAPRWPTASTSKPRPNSRSLMPEDAHQAIGHGVRGKRSKSGTISFDLLKGEDNRAAIQ